MKYVLALVAACCVLLTFLFVSAFKPHDSIDSNPGKSIERSDSEKRMSAYLAEERIKEIEVVKERIKGIQDRLDILRDNDPEKLSEQEISRQMKDFDLMRTLNVSFGFNTRLNKKQSLTIEPFLKYPLGGLGSENIRFGASGINVKLNFNTAKKP